MFLIIDIIVTLLVLLVTILGSAAFLSIVFVEGTATSRAGGAIVARRVFAISISSSFFLFAIPIIYLLGIYSEDFARFSLSITLSFVVAWNAVVLPMLILRLAIAKFFVSMSSFDSDNNNSDTANNKKNKTNNKSKSIFSYLCCCCNCFSIFTRPPYLGFISWIISGSIVFVVWIVLLLSSGSSPESNNTFVGMKNNYFVSFFSFLNKKNSISSSSSKIDDNNNVGDNNLENSQQQQQKSSSSSSSSSKTRKQQLLQLLKQRQKESPLACRYTSSDVHVLKRSGILGGAPTPNTNSKSLSEEVSAEKNSKSKSNNKQQQQQQQNSDSNSEAAVESFSSSISKRKDTDDTSSKNTNKQNQQQNDDDSDGSNNKDNDNQQKQKMSNNNKNNDNDDNDNIEDNVLSDTKQVLFQLQGSACLGLRDSILARLTLVGACCVAALSGFAAINAPVENLFPYLKRNSIRDAKQNLSRLQKRLQHVLRRWGHVSQEGARLTMQLKELFVQQHQQQQNAQMMTRNNNNTNNSSDPSNPQMTNNNNIGGGGQFYSSSQNNAAAAAAMESRQNVNNDNDNNSSADNNNNNNNGYFSKFNTFISSAKNTVISQGSTFISKIQQNTNYLFGQKNSHHLDATRASREVIRKRLEELRFEIAGYRYLASNLFLAIDEANNTLEVSTLGKSRGGKFRAMLGIGVSLFAAAKVINLLVSVSMRRLSGDDAVTTAMRNFVEIFQLQDVLDVTDVASKIALVLNICLVTSAVRGFLILMFRLTQSKKGSSSPSTTSTTSTSSDSEFGDFDDDNEEEEDDDNFFETTSTQNSKSNRSKDSNNISEEDAMILALVDEDENFYSSSSSSSKKTNTSSSSNNNNSRRWFYSLLFGGAAVDSCPGTLSLVSFSLFMSLHFVGAFVMMRLGFPAKSRGIIIEAVGTIPFVPCHRVHDFCFLASVVVTILVLRLMKKLEDNDNADDNDDDCFYYDDNNDDVSFGNNNDNDGGRDRFSSKI